ncbi:MAG: nuclease, partial [Anaerolineae bacterium]|nr:nuclease [Anaerolineae bacterium]
YGRLLRYVYIDETMVQGELMRGGYGYVYSRQPDVKYLKDMAGLEREAREQGAGLWTACEESTEAP